MSFRQTAWSPITYFFQFVPHDTHPGRSDTATWNRRRKNILSNEVIAEERDGMRKDLALTTFQITDADEDNCHWFSSSPVFVVVDVYWQNRRVNQIERYYLTLISNQSEMLISKLERYLAKLVTGEFDRFSIWFDWIDSWHNWRGRPIWPKNSSTQWAAYGPYDMTKFNGQFNVDEQRR